MNSFQDKLTPKSIKDHLQNLPKGIDAYDVAYGDAMERIYGQEKEHLEFAKLILSLVFCAARPLSIEELQHALAVQENDEEIDVDNILTIEDVCSICAGLIMLDEATHVIRFVHYTTQEYLDRHQRKWIPQARLEMARRCLWYLSLREFTLGPCEPYPSLQARCLAYPFASYTAEHGFALWDTLFEECDSSLDLDFSNRMLGCIKALPVVRSMRQISDVSGRKRKILIPLLRKHKPLLDTAIHWFAFEGWLGLLRLCLEQGFDINQQNKQGMTPLYLAASNHKLEVVEFLLTYERSDTSATGSEGNTSSTGADQKSGVLETFNNRLEEVKMSRHINCLDANIPNDEGVTPLAFAAGNGMSDMVQLLLTSDKVDPNAKNGEGRAALSIAIRCEYRSSARRWDLSSDSFIGTSRALCASHRVDLNAKDDLGRTPLYYAAQQSRYFPEMIDLVAILLQSDKVDTKPALVVINMASQEVRELVEHAHRMRQSRLQTSPEASAL